MDKEQTRK